MSCIQYCSKSATHRCVAANDVTGAGCYPIHYLLWRYWSKNFVSVPLCCKSTIQYNESRTVPITNSSPNYYTSKPKSVYFRHTTSDETFSRSPPSFQTFVVGSASGRRAFSCLSASSLPLYGIRAFKPQRFSRFRIVWALIKYSTIKIQQANLTVRNSGSATAACTDIHW